MSALQFVVFVIVGVATCVVFSLLGLAFTGWYTARLDRIRPLWFMGPVWSPKTWKPWR